MIGTRLLMRAASLVVGLKGHLVKLDGGAYDCLGGIRVSCVHEA